MEDLVALFKASPFEAIGTVVVVGISYLWKNKQEKKAEVESRGVDAREIERLNKENERVNGVNALIAKERDEANDRADAAFAKQLELTERFSEMRAQNAQMSAQMETISKQLDSQASENKQLRDQVKQLTEQVHDITVQNNELNTKLQKLQTTLNTGTAQ